MKRYLLLCLALCLLVIQPYAHAEVEIPPHLEHLQKKDDTSAWTGIPDRLVMRSVGDVLIHDRVSWIADIDSPIYQETMKELEEYGLIRADGLPWGGELHKEKVEGSEQYDFTPMLAHIMPFISYADVSIANLEVIAAYPELPMSGYPNFNAPASVLESLKMAGIDIVSNGTNHTLDWGLEGVLASIEHLESMNIMYSGSYKDYDDLYTPRIIEENGISLGFLTYSYGTNGIPLPTEYAVNLIDIDRMLADVEDLKQQVDAVVVTLQLGEEYDEYPAPYQEEIFQALADAGVKVILGGHPHVLQPIDWLNDGETFVIYSQASFMTGQRELENKQGGITEVTLERGEDGEVYVADAKFMPLFMLGIEAEKMYQTVPLADWDYYQIPEGEEWWSILKKRMTSFTDEFSYVQFLETAWTEELQ